MDIRQTRTAVEPNIGFAPTDFGYYPDTETGKVVEEALGRRQTLNLCCIYFIYIYFNLKSPPLPFSSTVIRYSQDKNDSGGSIGTTPDVNSLLLFYFTGSRYSPDKNGKGVSISWHDARRQLFVVVLFHGKSIFTRQKW